MCAFECMLLKRRLYIPPSYSTFRVCTRCTPRCPRNSKSQQGTENKCWRLQCQRSQTCSKQGCLGRKMIEVCLAAVLLQWGSSSNFGLRARKLRVSTDKQTSATNTQENANACKSVMPASSKPRISKPGWERAPPFGNKFFFSTLARRGLPDC